MSVIRNQEISCQQVLVEDFSVFSVQWSVFPARIAGGLSAEHLLQRYLAYIRRCTAGIIRPLQGPQGIEFRLWGSDMSLISFLPPVTNDHNVILQICGGVLVQPRQCKRGELQFVVEQVEEGVKVELQLSDFCPLILGSPSPSFIRRWLYRLTQALIHRLVTIRFLVLLHRELVGTRATVRVLRVRVRDGHPT